MASRVEPAQDLKALASVEALLDRLREKLNAGVSWELKRQLVEVLVDGITVDTIESGARREAVITVRYKFVSSVDTCTDRRACNKRDLSLRPECRAAAAASHPAGIEGTTQTRGPAWCAATRAARTSRPSHGLGGGGNAVLTIST